jgi:hypothetical protein
MISVMWLLKNINMTLVYFIKSIQIIKIIALLHSRQNLFFGGGWSALEFELRVSWLLGRRSTT